MFFFLPTTKRSQSSTPSLKLLPRRKNSSEFNSFLDSFLEERIAYNIELPAIEDSNSRLSVLKENI